ncbi:WXG100-like domain-containing protein [Gordonia sp. 852002-50395_SCH5434458]|uniref:WXG100-like domain-containing protein n=1 Tax=Gordonia sp. 852002-50395_SCH5434458 TaxID=1834090 RepID=UPI000AC7E211|nr:GH-E family nuclease [Gordonia sp. 852002-50395_SCH5434458]
MSPPPSRTSPGLAGPLLGPLDGSAPTGEIDNEPGSYTWTATKTVGTMQMRLQEDITELTGVLSGLGGMAGTDHAGQTWASAYDDAVAGGGMEAAGGIVNVAAVFHNMMLTSGLNYSAADSAGTAIPVAPRSSSPGMKPVGYQPPSPPSAFGGGSGPPSWWGLIAGYVQGVVWPNGDPGRLRAAGAAWRTAGQNVIASIQYLNAADSKLTAQKAPELPHMLAAIADLSQQTKTVGDVFIELGAECDRYAQQIEDTHSKVYAEVVKLLAETVAIEAAAVISGVGAVAVQAAVVARTTLTGARVAAIIRDFLRLVEGLSMFGPRYAGAFAGTNAALDTWKGAGPIIASISVGRGDSRMWQVFGKLRRPKLDPAVEAAVIAAAKTKTINGQEFYVNGADKSILIPVSGKYNDPAITSGPLVPAWPGGKPNYYFHDGHYYPKDTTIHIGHRYGEENWRQLADKTGKMNQWEFNELMNNPNLYRLEDAYGNSSHYYEKPR